MAEELVVNRKDWDGFRSEALETAETYPWQNTINRFEGMLVRAAAGGFPDEDSLSEALATHTVVE